MEIREGEDDGDYRLDVNMEGWKKEMTSPISVITGRILWMMTGLWKMKRDRREAESEGQRTKLTTMT